MRILKHFNQQWFSYALALAVLGGTQALSQTAVQAWAQRYSAPAEAADSALKTAVDSFGAVIVAGSSTGGNGGDDWLTIKYNSAGIPLWTNRYDGPAHSYDDVAALAVDGSGNIFVTGYSASNSQAPYNYDEVTIKYSSAGVALWTNRYDGPAQSDDFASAMAVDGSGNAFVTGNSYNTNASSDYLTVKYSTAGALLWAKRYNGPGDQYDNATAVAVDGHGDVSVTGNSQLTDGTAAIVTIKYSSTGVELWTNVYNNLGNYFFLSPFLAADAIGDVFVAGNLDYNDGVNVDFATIAYSSGGSPLWTNYYNGPGTSYDFPTAVAADGGGNVIVTGGSSGDGNFVASDYTTIKYSGAGVPLWTNVYHGPVVSFDFPNAMTVDVDGNVFVTGGSGGNSGGTTNSDYATIKYSGEGVPLWTNRYDGPANGDDNAYAVGVDGGGGNVFVAGGSGGSFATLKYAGNGALLWMNRYNDGLGNAVDQATALAVDGSGNLFVTGYSTGIGSGFDYATIKYTSGGVALWTNRYNGPGNSVDVPLALAVDAGGNVVVTGYSASSHRAPFDWDYATVKYSGSGVALWTNRYNGLGNFDDNANAIAVDGSGNVFVTGASPRTNGFSDNNDFVTIKYSGAGVPLWTNRYNGPAKNEDYALALAVDNSGNAYVIGNSATNFGVNYDIITIKYSGAGLAVWTNRYNGTGNDDGVAAEVDSNGNLFVTGLSAGDDGDYDYVTLKYSSAGALLWVNRYDGGNGDDQVFAMAVDTGGNVIVTGQSVGLIPYIHDYATIKYSGAGVPLWTNRYDGPANGEDVANGVAVDASGTVFVTGFSTGLGNRKDYATIAYSSAGTALWTNRYNGPSGGDDVPGDTTLNLETRQMVALDPDGGVYVTGGSDAGVNGTAIDFVTVKYVVPPNLNIKLVSPATAKVFWPSPSMGYDLQVNNNLAATNWVTPAETVQDDGTSKYIIVSTPATNHFYRLRGLP